MKNQRGEIATVLTILSLGIMLIGVVVGNIAVQQQTRPETKARIKDSDNIEGNKLPLDQLEKGPTALPKKEQDIAQETQATATPVPPPTNTPAPPSIPTAQPRLSPLPDHSYNDCGGPQNQCDPRSGDPNCGNDGCLHAAVGRPTPVPTLAPPAGLTATPLPGYKQNDCGGPWYQCTPGEYGCGNDGCSNIKLGRPFDQPVPIPPGTTVTPIPGRTTDQCGGRYYQCANPGIPPCGNDGCRDDLLRRSQYSINLLGPTPTITPTPIPGVRNPSPTPNPRTDPCLTCAKKDSCVDGKWCGNDCKYHPEDNNDIAYGCKKANGTITTPTPVPADRKRMCGSPPRCERGIWCGNDGVWHDEAGIREGCRDINGRITTPTPRPTNALPRPQTASMGDWARVQTLAVEGKVNAQQISAWVYEAAKYYYPGIKTSYCSPSKGECDFKL